MNEKIAQNMRKLLSIQAWAAAALIVLSTTVMTGWIVHDATMVQVRPDFGAMVFSTAMGFGLIGIALVLPLFDLRFTAKAHLAIGSILIATGVLILLEYLPGRNLWIDLPSLHAWLNDGNPRPGRAAPGAGIGALLAGLVLLMMHRVRSKLHGGVIIASTFVILVWGLGVLASYLLHLDLLYPWFPPVRMPAFTGVGMIVSGIGLWTHWRNAQWYRTQRFFQDDERIGLVAVTILTVIAVAAGVIGFGVQQVTLERSLSDNLASHLKDQTTLFQAIVRQSVTHAENAATHVDLIRLVSDSDRNGVIAGARGELDRIGQNLLSEGFRGIAVYDRRERELLRRGSFGQEPQIETDLGLGTLASLRWEGVLYLNTRSTIMDQGQAVGVLEVEQPLHLISEQFANDKGFGATGEMGMCIRQSENLRCFPQRRNPAVYTASRRSGSGTLTAMSHAVDGETGIFKGLDYRGHQVIAAYGPLTASGLGIVIKQDAEELFRPIREQLQWYLPLLLLLVTGSALLLRAQFKPMVLKLLDSERNATDKEMHLRAVIDNVGEGVFTLDERGVRGGCRSCNPRNSLTTFEHLQSFRFPSHPWAAMLFVTDGARNLALCDS